MGPQGDILGRTFPPPAVDGTGSGTFFTGTDSTYTDVAGNDTAATTTGTVQFSNTSETVEIVYDNNNDNNNPTTLSIAKTGADTINMKTTDDNTITNNNTTNNNGMLMMDTNGMMIAGNSNGAYNLSKWLEEDSLDFVGKNRLFRSFFILGQVCMCVWIGCWGVHICIVTFIIFGPRHGQEQGEVYRNIYIHRYIFIIKSELSVLFCRCLICCV